MRNFFSEARARQLGVGWSIVIVVGLFVTKWVLVLPSIGIAGLCLTAVGYAVSQRRIGQRVQARPLLSFAAVYLLHVVGGLYHDSINNKGLLLDLLLQLPFLLFPIAFLLLPGFLPTQKRMVWLTLLSCCVVSALAATGNYLAHFNELNWLYNRSQVMPTEPDHIRFSLLISMAILIGVVMLLARELTPRWRWLVAAGIGFLFLFQHLLAVRSGLISLYIGGLALVGWMSWQPGYRKISLSILAIAAILGGVCFWLLPTLRVKITNTVYDFSQREVASAANKFSITARIYSYKIAGVIIREHPLLGVGKSRLATKMAEQYAYSYPEITANNYLLPHNQFLYTLASFGAVGLVVFLMGFYYACWVSMKQSNVQALLMYIIISISFLGEYTLETNIGVIVGSFFILLALEPDYRTWAPSIIGPAYGLGFQKETG